MLENVFEKEHEFVFQDEDEEEVRWRQEMKIIWTSGPVKTSECLIDKHVLTKCIQNDIHGV